MWFVGGVKGRIFEKDEGVVDWCGPRSIWEEEFFGEVSGWVRKGSDLKSTHHYDSREDLSGGGTLGSHDY